MPRPFKCRRVGFCPEITYFKPAGIPLRHLEEVVLTTDELEALRLADIEGLYQEAAALKMEISRQTFGNIINSAHKKMADALVNAKAIKIEQRLYAMEKKRKFICSGCSHEWEEDFGTGRPEHCPQCQSQQFQRSSLGKGFARTGCSQGQKQCGRERKGVVINKEVINMPEKDGTGPLGQGSGKGRGRCKTDASGQAGQKRGQGRGQGQKGGQGQRQGQRSSK